MLAPLTRQPEYRMTVRTLGVFFGWKVSDFGKIEEEEVVNFIPHPEKSFVLHAALVGIMGERPEKCINQHYPS